MTASAIHSRGSSTNSLGRASAFRNVLENRSRARGPRSRGEFLTATMTSRKSPAQCPCVVDLQSIPSRVAVRRQQTQQPIDLVANIGAFVVVKTLDEEVEPVPRL